MRLYTAKKERLNESGYDTKRKERDVIRLFDSTYNQREETEQIADDLYNALCDMYNSLAREAKNTANRQIINKLKDLKATIGLSKRWWDKYIFAMNNLLK